MTIARRFGSKIWDLNSLINFFNDELTACESCKPLSKSSDKRWNRKGDQGFTASCLHGQVSNHKPKTCYFCNKPDHRTSKCTSVTNIDTRKDILKRKYLCFVCLKTGHLARNCTSNYSCQKCQKKHHISICTEDNQSERSETNSDAATSTAATFVSARDSVLLETASAKVSGIYGSKDLNARVLFDCGSQRSYVSQALCKSLKLKPLRSERVIIGTFGSTQKKVSKLDVFEIRIKSSQGGRSLTVEVFGVPVICKPLTGQDM